MQQSLLVSVVLRAAWLGQECLCCVPVKVLSFESPPQELGADARGEQSNVLDRETKQETHHGCPASICNVLPSFTLVKAAENALLRVSFPFLGQAQHPAFQNLPFWGLPIVKIYLNLPVTLRGCLQRGRNPKASLPVLHFGSSSKITSQLSQT